MARDGALRLEVEDTLARILKLDVMRAARLVTHDQLRFLVDYYYIKQKDRQSLKSQYEALHAAHKPAEVIYWWFLRAWRTENDLRKLLDLYTNEEPTGLGLWTKAIYGLGPVISAGLLAYIDITRAPTVGHIWAFGGYDPTMKWYGREESVNIVQAVMAELHTTAVTDDVIATVAARTNKRPERLLQWAREYSVPKKRLQTVTDEEDEGDEEEHPDRDLVRDEDGVAMARRDLTDVQDRPQQDDRRERKTETFLESPPLTVAALARALSRRPWNQRLCTLFFKIGDCFRKFSKHPECYYGHLYRERKLQEMTRNVKGLNRETAARVLAEKRIRRETVAYHWYRKGMLPPSQLDARARRWTVKIFLSAWHEEAYRRHYGAEPPLPYPLAHLGHVHKSRCRIRGRGRRRPWDLRTR